MHINYLEDDDLAFLPECSEAHLEAFTRILTRGGKWQTPSLQHAPAQRDIFSDGGAPGALSPQLAANRR